MLAMIGALRGPACQISGISRMIFLATENGSTIEHLAASVAIQPGAATRDGALGASETLPRRDRVRDDGRSAIAECPAAALPSVPLREAGGSIQLLQ